MSSQKTTNNILALLNNEVEVPDGLWPIMERYIENLMNDLNALSSSIESHNREKAREVIHKIRGTANSFGFEVVDTFMEEISEQLAKEDYQEARELKLKIQEYVSNFQAKNL